MTPGIFEIADIAIVAGGEEDFAAAVEQARPLFQAAQGCRGLTLTRSIEHPAHFQLVVHWDTVEDHVVGFRGSPAFAQWRALVGAFFAATPQVEHHVPVIAAD